VAAIGAQLLTRLVHHLHTEECGLSIHSGYF
jgi:hypothetical protein